MKQAETHIKPSTGFSLGLQELWQYRELFYFFTWRDIKVKYKQTLLGILWALLQPLGMMAIFTFLFSRTWPINTGTVPYPIFVLSGLICWNLFSSAVATGSESMIQQSNVINKIYFPRLIIPGSAVLVSLFDYMMGLIVFFIFCAVYSQSINITALVYIPAAILLAICAAFGMSSFLSALTIKYRDFRYTIPFLVQVLFFASQVIYPLAAVKEAWVRNILAFHPVNAVIELFRSPLYGTVPDWHIVAAGTASTLVILLAGLYYFKKTEAYFADLA